MHIHELGSRVRARPEGLCFSASLFRPNFMKDTTTQFGFLIIIK